MPAAMGRRLQILLASIVGIAAGFVLGGAWLGPLNEPPARPRLAKDAGGPSGLAGPATPTDAALADLLAGRNAASGTPSGQHRAADADVESGQEVLVPAMAAEKSPILEDASLVARGPGQFALLDLAAAQVGRLHIRQGVMERDGAGRFAKWAKNPRVGQLRGRQVRVELLHLGFDGDGRPTVAHIRTTEDPPVEGVVSLMHDEKYIAVRPVPRPSGEDAPGQLGAPQEADSDIAHPEAR